MREIKFRGKAIHPSMQGKWVYGYYVNADLCEDKEVLGNHWIYTGFEDERYQVNPESVGQFTGLYDINGKEIYEGDIVKTPEEFSKKPLVVKYSVGSFSLYNPNCCEECKNGIGCVCYLVEVLSLEVVGNIYENKELLENKNV